MEDEPQATCYPRGLEDEFPEGPPTVVIKHRGFRFVLRFAEGDFFGKGELQKLELLPDEQDLKPRALRRFAPDAEVYVQYARAQMRLFGSEDEPVDTPEIRIQRIRDSADALRKLAGPGRSQRGEFLRRIVQERQALLEGGERHPVKALAENHNVTISAASHWLREARVRGFLPEKVSA
jgi:hypothetical protein